RRSSCVWRAILTNVRAISRSTLRHPALTRFVCSREASSSSTVGLGAGCPHNRHVPDFMFLRCFHASKGFRGRRQSQGLKLVRLQRSVEGLAGFWEFYLRGPQFGRSPIEQVELILRIDRRRISAALVQLSL